MTIVFVHGNPESDAIWGPLRSELGRTDTVCLSPPGFGAPLPEGFGATVLEYCEWLIGELEAIGEPVDLVGHDWGGGHVVNVAMHRPDLLRSWVSDAVGVFAPEYVWHDAARIWQTPGAGEELVDKMMKAPREARVRRNVGLGMPVDVAEAVADAQGDEMGRAILALYRSAAQPAMAELGKELENAASRPGLNIVATEDGYVGGDGRIRAGERAGAQIARLEGLGHWWMLQDPARGAAVLADFFAAAPGTSNLSR
ncbi:alpha/beta hydrolase [Skermania sp. ID1734]|uniref:alpha/beta fold hydrolase n=1 Tax=Skermania sp. ID1734 TaxID=2597516 RepID=UPI00117CD0D7|nr:alpha/beta hydrolase [Skermania sp. ID1734]TSD99799.1 alpha/beta hydrolase [Skermania sp. ID1734]